MPIARSFSIAWPLTTRRLAAVLGLSALLSSIGASALALTDWYCVKAQGQAIGTLSIHSYPAPQSASPEQITEIEIAHHFQRAGQPFVSGTHTQYVEDASGTPIRFTHRAQLADVATSQTQGTIAGNQLAFSLQQADSQLSHTTAIQPEAFLFPTGERIRKVFQAHYSDSPGQTFRFQTLHLALAPHLVEAEVTAEGPDTLTLAGGQSYPVKRFKLVNPKQPDHLVQEWRDASGKLVKAVAQPENTELVFVAQADDADGSESGLRVSRGGTSPLLAPAHPMDVMSATQIRTNRMIPHPRQVKKGTYRLLTKNGAAIPRLPQDDRQTILRQDAQSVTLQVTPATLSLPLSPYPIAFAQRYLQSTPYLQASDPELKTLAQLITKGETRADAAAQKLQQWVYQNISNKNLAQGFLSAKQTYEQREGDCTEHAVLLAALARAIGIPSRVAVGVEYLPSGDQETGSFVFHMWTEVFIGKSGAQTPQGNWLALDATNPEPFVDATHIKLSDSDLADPDAPVRIAESVMGLMGQLQIDVVNAAAPAYTQLSLPPKAPEEPTVYQPVDIEALDIQQLSRQAIKQYRIAIPQEDVFDNSLDGYVSAGALALSKGQYDQAMALFQKASGEARSPIAQFYLAERLSGLEVFPMARQAFTQAAQGDSTLAPLAARWQKELFPTVFLTPSQEKAYFQAIAESLNTSQAAPDTAILEQLANQAVGYWPAALHLGRLALADKQYKQAETWLRRYQQLAPQDPRALAALAQVSLQQRQFNQAVERLQSAFRLANTLQSLPGQSLAVDLESQLLVAKGRALVNRQLNSPAGWMMIGKGLYQETHPFEALSAFRKVAKMPANAYTAEALGYVVKILMETDDWGSAMIWAPQLKAKAGGHPFALAALGYYEMRMRQYPAARQHLTQAIARAPYHAIANQILANLLLRLKSPAAGITSLKQGLTHLAKLPETPLVRKERRSVQHQLAKLLLIQQPGEAYGLAQQLIADDPLDAVAYEVAAQALLKEGQPQQALAPIAKAVILEPHDANILTLAGDIHAQLGNTNDALFYYDKALTLLPSHPGASRALALLIEEKQLQRKKPRLYLELNDDERDYLVILNLKIALYKLTEQSFSQTIKELNNVQWTNMYERKMEFMKGFQRFYTLIQNQYRWSQTIQPPERMRQIHYQFAQTLYAVLGFLGTSEGVLASFAGTPTQEQLTENPYLKAETQNLLAAETQLSTLQRSILERLNPQVVNDIEQITTRAYQVSPVPSTPTVKKAQKESPTSGSGLTLSPPPAPPGSGTFAPAAETVPRTTPAIRP